MPRTRSPPEALTVKEELLPIVHERLVKENKSKINKNSKSNNVALVNASHGCRDKIQQTIWTL